MIEKEQHISNDLLITSNSINGENELEILDNKLISDDRNSKLISINEKLGGNDKNIEIKLNETINFDILIYNIKDFILMIILLLSSVINYNYLYLPFILVSLFNKNSILQLKENSRQKKLLIEIILIIYSVILLISKLILLIIVSKNDYNKNIFIDLGVSYKENNFSFFRIDI